MSWTTITSCSSHPTALCGLDGRSSFHRAPAPPVALPSRRHAQAQLCQIHVSMLKCKAHTRFMQIARWMCTQLLSSESSEAMSLHNLSGWPTSVPGLWCICLHLPHVGICICASVRHSLQGMDAPWSPRDGCNL